MNNMYDWVCLTCVSYWKMAKVILTTGFPYDLVDAVNVNFIGIDCIIKCQLTIFPLHENVTHTLCPLPLFLGDFAFGWVKTQV